MMVTIVRFLVHVLLTPSHAEEAFDELLSNGISPAEALRQVVTERSDKLVVFVAHKLPDVNEPFQIASPIAHAQLMAMEQDLLAQSTQDVDLRSLA